MQFITLFARDYATRGAAAYVQLIQRKERENKVETLTHQKWSGSKMVDEMGGVLWKEIVAAHRGVELGRHAYP